MKRELILRWLKKAESDFKSAQILLNSEDPPTDVICFHCQQVAEKCLKAFLTKEDIRAGKTHDLDALFEMCLERDKDFAAIDKKALSQLTIYAVDIRYPDEFYLPSIEEAKESFEIASEIKEFVLKKLGIKEQDIK